MNHELLVNGVELRVEVDGDGPPLLLVNGAFCTLRQWDLVLGDLVEHFRVVRHDVRGTGQSAPGPADEYRFEQYADDIMDITAQLGVGEFALWGMAWGARVALVTAARNPHAVSRLVLSDLGIDPADVEAQKALGAEAKAKRAAAGIVDPPPIDGAFDHADRDAAAAALAATRHHEDLMSFVQRVVAPTLIATGDHDPNLASSERALAGLSDGRLEILPLVGHGSVLRCPDQVCDAVLPFLLT